MASNTRVVTAVPSTVFDFDTVNSGTVSFFSNDLNINWRVLVQAPGVLLNLHSGPILFITSFAVGPGARVTAAALTLGSAFAAPPQSLLQLQTDTISQAPAATEHIDFERRTGRKITYAKLQLSAS